MSEMGVFADITPGTNDCSAFAAPTASLFCPP